MTHKVRAVFYIVAQFSGSLFASVMLMLTFGHDMDTMGGTL